MSYQPPNNQPWQQPPNTSYPPQQPFQTNGLPPSPPAWQQSPMPPKKKSKTWLWILIALFIGFGIGYSAHTSGSQSASVSTVATTQATSQPTLAPTQAPTQPAITPTPTHTPIWITTHTYTGNGAKKTATFTVPDEWKILYTCTYQKIDTVTADGALSVSVYGSDASIIDPAAVDVTCKNGVAKIKGETEEHQSGTVYLDINGTGDWTIQVQELK